MYKKIFSCKNKVAVVTGGAGLLGKEIVKALSEFGATVYIADNDEKKASRLVGKNRIKFLYQDITSEDSIINSLETIKSENGRLDILVNAAFPRTQDWENKIDEVSFESWKDNMNSHLGGYFLSSRFAAQIMKKQKAGSIINLASIYGVSAPDFRIYKGTSMTMPVAYASIKAGIIAFTKYIATYYAPYKIRANVISPGGVFSGQSQKFVKKYNERTPLARMAKPEEIIGAVIYLASEASSYVTGHNLIVDGGWTIW